MGALLGGFVGFLVGVAVTYFVARNNRKWIDRALASDQYMKRWMDETIARIKGR